MESEKPQRVKVTVGSGCAGEGVGCMFVCFGIAAILFVILKYS